MKMPEIFETFFFSICRKFQKLTALKIRGHSLSPVKHLYIRSELEDREAECKALQAIADKVSMFGSSLENACFYSNLLFFLL